MTCSSHLDWPFLEPHHKALAIDLDRWAGRELSDELQDHSVRTVDDACRKLVRQLGDGGWLKYAIGGIAYGAFADVIDYPCSLPYSRDAGPPFGPGRFCICHAGIRLWRNFYLRYSRAEATLPSSRGQRTAIAAFAISEPDAGSRCCRTTVRRQRKDGDSYLITGEKTLESPMAG